MASSASPPSLRPRFANYPTPIEAQNIKYEFGEDKNPAMRGLSIAIAGAIVSRSNAVAKLLFNNAGFGSIKDMPELQYCNWRFHPTVIPLSDEVSSTETGRASHIPMESELQARRPSDLPGRYHTAADYHSLYKSGELSPVDVVQTLSAFAVRGADDKLKDYQTAWTYSNVDDALVRARESEARYREGKPLGILDGVPVAVKDDCDVKGYRSCNGMLPQDGVEFFNPANESIWPVRQLQDAGAIVVGKCTMHQLGSDTTGCNPHWGTPTNWYNPSYYPGGSSSGPASAVCAGLIPITVATDAGGSIRIPPAFTGTYGLKVSHDRTRSMNSTVCVTGPLCSTATDLTIAYRIMSQPCASEPTQGMFALSQPPSPDAKRYIGICRPWFDRADKQVHEHCTRAIDYFANSLGYDIVDIDLPYLREGQLAHAGLTLAEMADRCRHKGRTSWEWMKSLSSPNQVLMSVGRQASTADYLKFGQIRQVLMQHMAFLFQKYPNLLVVTPTTPLAGWKRSKGDDAYGFSDGNASIRNMTYVWLANSTGCPAVSVPVGYAEPEQGEGQLPVGLMAMGEWGSEESLLRWARESEEYLHETYPGGRIRPAGWVDVLGLAAAKNKEVVDKKVAEEENVKVKGAEGTSVQEGP